MSWLREPNAEPIPGYRLIEPLGSGGFGEVWKCEAPGGLHKAIKIVYGNLNSLDVDGARAEQELHALERIKEVRHPFVCSLERIEKVDGELVIVMELAERTLHDFCQECQGAGMIGIPRDNLLHYLRDAAEALDHMNEKHNLQHLDVKPRNLFLISDRVKVADFGLVKHLERQGGTGIMGGVTPLYAAPETFSGKISQHSDQYSLAIVYQELLTGHRPFSGKNVRQLAQQHMQEDPDLRSLPEHERPIVARALSKDPAKRFPSCLAFMTALYRSRAAVRVEVPAGARAGNGTHAALEVEDLSLENLDFEKPAASSVQLPTQRKKTDSQSELEVSQLGLTVAQPESGALRPTLIIGLGGFGRKALLELRCRFLDRFGELGNLPIVRFLCIDTDPEAAQVAVRGAPEVALTRGEFCQLPLQQVGNYRRRMLEQISEWLPREKLYALPRSLQTQGIRALARLAFADNQQRLLARLRREIQEITNPDKLYQTVTQTGLALRDNTPRIYVIAAAGGGSSGLLPDLGYALRRLLDKMRHSDSPVTAFLLAGAPQDPATPKPELANTYATLTELNHFSDPVIPFCAQYGVEGQRIVDQGMPFQATYLLPLANRTPDSLDESLAHLGSYLFHELTTPLGIRLDHLRNGDNISPPAGVPALPVRSFGTYAIWFPRGLLLRLASRFACRRLLENWLVSGEEQIAPQAAAEISTFHRQVMENPELTPAALAQCIEKGSTGPAVELGATSPGEALTSLLAKLEEQSQQSVAHEDPGNWARGALSRVREWIGDVEDEAQGFNEWRKTKLSKALTSAAQKLAEDWDQQLSRQLFALMEHAGARLAAAEASLAMLQKFCHQATENLQGLLKQQADLSAQGYTKVEAALQECVAGGGGFRFFSRSRTKQLRNYIDCLSQFTRQRLAEEVTIAVRHFFGALAGRLTDRSRDLGFCRQRLRHLLENLERPTSEAQDETLPGADFTLSKSPMPSTDAFWEAIRQSATARVMLPQGEEDLERAAIRFLQTLTVEDWQNLDVELHERVLLPRGGLHGACTNSADLTRTLAAPLLEETSALLGQHLPIMDVAQILGGEFGLNLDNAATTPGAAPELKQQTEEYFQKAVPLIQGATEATQQSFLLVPASPAGKTLGEAVAAVSGNIQTVRVPGQADLMFCREQGSLTADDLQALLKPCRAAYDTLAGAPPTSPHARFDISDWLPLDP